MRTKTIVTAAFAGAAAVATTAALAWPHPATADGRHGQALHLTTRTDQFAFVDEGAPGPSVGDRLVFSDRVHRDGKPVGTAASIYTFAGVTATTAVYDVSTTFALPEGQIVLHGIAEGPNHPPAPGEEFRFTLAVTGGTGQYRAARGDAEGVDAGGGEERYTVRVTR